MYFQIICIFVHHTEDIFPLLNDLYLQVCHIHVFNFFLASGDFCHLLINFANSLDPDWG